MSVLICTKANTEKYRNLASIQLLSLESNGYTGDWIALTDDTLSFGEGQSVFVEEFLDESFTQFRRTSFDYKKSELSQYVNLSKYDYTVILDADVVAVSDLSNLELLLPRDSILVQGEKVEDGKQLIPPTYNGLVAIPRALYSSFFPVWRKSYKKNANTSEERVLIEALRDFKWNAASFIQFWHSMNEHTIFAHYIGRQKEELLRKYGFIK